MTTKVVPRYEAAYRILNSEIIQPILNFDESLIQPENTDITNDYETSENPEVINDNTKFTTEETINEITTIENIDDNQSVSIDQANNQTTQNSLFNDKNVTSDYMGNETMIDEYLQQITTEQASTDNETMIDEYLQQITAEPASTDNEESATSAIEAIYVIQLKQATNVPSRLKLFADQLELAANSVYTNLKTASSECERLRIQLNAEIATTIVATSQQEELLRQLSSTISQLESDVRYQEQQVAFAEQTVRERQTAVENAERELRNAEDRVEKARLCRGKRFIGGWWRKHVEKPIVQAVQNVVVKPVCAVVNMGGIDNAKNARSSAGNMLNDARQRLSNQQAELARRRSQLSDVQVRRNAANQRRDVLNLELSNLRTKYAIISSLSEKFMGISTYVATVVGTSQTLNTEIKRLVDFELVIEPLNTLARQMMQNGLMSSFGFEISATTVTTVDRILDRINEKLSRFPLLNRKTTSTK